MILLHLSKVNKITHRKAFELKVIIHDINIKKITESNNKDLIELFDNLNKHCYRENRELQKAIQNNEITIQMYYKIRTFWDNLLSKLPKVLVDGRIKTGEHKFISYENVFFKVRNSERYKDQVIEIIYI